MSEPRAARLAAFALRPGERALGFAARWRLRRRPEFLRVQNEGRKFVTEHFLIFARANGLPHPRIGITASRKVGKAHARNRVKRLVREVFRVHKACFPPGLDVVVIVRSHAAEVRHAQVERELLFYCSQRGKRPPRERSRGQ